VGKGSHLTPYSNLGQRKGNEIFDGMVDRPLHLDSWKQYKQIQYYRTLHVRASEEVGQTRSRTDDGDQILRTDRTRRPHVHRSATPPPLVFTRDQAKAQGSALSVEARAHHGELWMEVGTGARAMRSTQT
jgi:hypothetical protein